MENNHMQSQSLASDFKPQTREDLEEELINDELFLSEPGNTKAIHCLNSGAAIIWYLCDGSRTLADITAEIVSMSDREQTTVLQEVRDTVTRFKQLHLIH